MDLEKIKNSLIHEWNYSEAEAADVLPQISSMPEELRNEMLLWFETGVIESKLAFYGISLHGIMETLHLIPPASFLLLAWIHDDPNKAFTFIVREYGNETFQKLKSSQENI